ncbi:MAG: class I SAM-dependent methyltransferase [bacterium]
MHKLQQVADICVEKLTLDQSGNARRLFHGRGHTYPGLEHVVVTYYPPFLHIALYDKVEQSALDQLVAALSDSVHVIEGVVVQRRSGRHTQTEVVRGDVPTEHLVTEHGLSFWIAPTRNQNAGLFLDMGHVRSALQPSMPDAKVLNLFAYTCAFSVSALAHGAQLVVNNDMNANMLRIGRRNHQANDQDLRKVKMLAHNVLKAWKKIRMYGPYDVVIIDPPTNQRGGFVAEKHYARILQRIPEFAAPGARVIACLNSPFLNADFLANQVSRWAPGCRLQGSFAVHPDFPEAFSDRGLKVLDYRYQP